MAGHAVEEGPRPEPAAVEVVAADDVAQAGEELPEAAPVALVLGDDREEAPLAVCKTKATISR